MAKAHLNPHRPMRGSVSGRQLTWKSAGPIKRRLDQLHATLDLDLVKNRELELERLRPTSGRLDVRRSMLIDPSDAIVRLMTASSAHVETEWC